jgi:hypothetical protein
MAMRDRILGSQSDSTAAASLLVDVCGLDLTQPLLFTVPGVLTEQECSDFIKRIDAAEPTPAPIHGHRGPVMRPDVRNNSRVFLNDPRLAADLFERIFGYIPHRLLRMWAVGVNELFRCYHYAPGQRFALHSDGTFARNREERSLLTFLIYLNQGMRGGETAFPEQGQCIIPQTGMALLFQHPLVHEGCTVQSGVKYVLRSDVMYRTCE